MLQFWVNKKSEELYTDYQNTLMNLVISSREETLLK